VLGLGRDYFLQLLIEQDLSHFGLIFIDQIIPPVSMDFLLGFIRNSVVYFLYQLI
jgi:hypothetical protein